MVVATRRLDYCRSDMMTSFGGGVESATAAVVT